jgi:hypothetical protein
MSAKKRKPEEERKPDLAAPDQDAIEQRVREMLDISEEEINKKEVSEPVEPKTITVAHHEDEPAKMPESKAELPKKEEETIASAPVLPNFNTDETNVEKLKDNATDNVEELNEASEPTETVLNLDEAPKDEALISEDEILAEPLLEDETSEDSQTKKGTELSPDEKEPKLEETLDDPKTSRAVDDIIAQEGDALLAAEDEKAAQALPPKKSGFLARTKQFFKAWWNNPKLRWSTLIGVALLVLAAFAIPTSRYAIFNAVGLRGQVSLTVLDESTNQPLKNVQVNVAGVTEKTDQDGKVEIKQVKLGATELVIAKRAFAEEKRKMVVHVGDNNLGQSKLKPVGVQYSFVVTDFLSGKPLEKAEAASGEASAFSDSEGKIKLTVDESDDDSSFEVTIKLENYRDEKITLTEESITEQAVVLVPVQKHVFVSKKTGTYDLYSVDLDGKNEKLVLAGTGSERDDIDIASHPSSDNVALVSTRGNQRNKDGYLLSQLTLIDLATEKSVTVTTSERVQLIDWVGDRLVYVQATSGASATNPERHKLMSYDLRSGENKQLAASNYFNDVIVAKKKIYYAPSSAYQSGNTAQLYRVEADGSGQTVIVNKEIWSIFRTDYDNLAISAGQEWLNIRIGEDKATNLSNQPANVNSRSYIDSADGKHSLWIDNRDGKGVLIAYQPATQDEIILRSQNGVKAPVRWFNNKTVVYRVANTQETADYVISLDGSEPKKIRDVTDTGSVDKWYYY